MANLTFADLPDEVKAVGAECLGAGALRSLFRYNYVYHLIMRTQGDTVIGFVLYHFEKIGKGSKRQSVGVIDTACVAPEFQGNGYGTLLMFGALRKISSSGAHRIEIVSKLPKDEKVARNRKTIAVKVDEYLRSLGLAFEAVYDNHYRDSSIRFSYRCLMCKELPDTCRGALYSVTDDGSEVTVEHR